MAREMMVVSDVRTVVRTSDDNLKDMAPCELGMLIVREALTRTGVKGEGVGHVMFGHVISTESRDMYPSCVAAVSGGVSVETPAFNVNHLCGSSLRAVVSAAQTVLLGDADTAIAGGTESMSRVSYLVLAARQDSRMSDAKMVDTMLGALYNPFHMVHMSVMTENVVRELGISREQQDQTVLGSHQYILHTVQAGCFKDQIVPMTIKSRKDDIQSDIDEHVHHNVTIDSVTKLEPTFMKENGTVTAGNALGLNDAGAVLVLAECSVAGKRGLKPLARLVSYGHTGISPKIMDIGPVPATRKALERAGLSAKNLDVIEANEAFAAQVYTVTKGLDLDPAKVNPNGSGISLGYPIDITGALITVRALYELQRVGGRYTLVTMCVGEGQGIATVFERI